MRYIARQVRNHWEDEALQAKLEEVRALEIGQPRLAAMGHLQIDESPARFGLTVLMDDILLHFPAAVWPQKAPTARPEFAAVNLADVVDTGWPGIWFILGTPRRCKVALGLTLRDGSAWRLAVSDRDVKQAIIERLSGVPATT